MYNRDNRGRFASRDCADGPTYLDATAGDRENLNRALEAKNRLQEQDQIPDALIASITGCFVAPPPSRDVGAIDPDSYVADCLRTESPEYPGRRTDRVIHAVLGLADEVGEMAKALKSHLYYGTEFDLDNLAEEIGDALWYVALLSDAIGMPLSQIMRANIAKLRARYPDRFTAEKALSRNLAAEKLAMKETH